MVELFAPLFFPPKKVTYISKLGLKVQTFESRKLRRRWVFYLVFKKERLTEVKGIKSRERNEEERPFFE